MSNPPEPPLRPFDPDYRPDPKKVTVYRGAFFNPWLNISACVIVTIGLAVATWWMYGLVQSTRAARSYPDQGLDVAGTLIGLVVLGLATIGLVVCTIFTIVWWSKRIREERERQEHPR